MIQYFFLPSTVAMARRHRDGHNTASRSHKKHHNHHHHKHKREGLSDENKRTIKVGAGLAAVVLFVVLAVYFSGALSSSVDSSVAITTSSSSSSTGSSSPPPSSSSTGSSLVSNFYTATINNAVPRRDVNGEIMDIHDGNIMTINNVFYYYGAQYGDCIEQACTNTTLGACGFNINHNVSLYTSTDFMNWTPAPTPVFQFARDFPIRGVMFCIKMIYNALTNLYVLWFNYYPGDLHLTSGKYGVATSASPFGPFTTVVQDVQTQYWTEDGDFTLFLDPKDGKGFLMYTGGAQSEIITIEQLNPSFTGTLGQTGSSAVMSTGREAPAMMYNPNNGKYYAFYNILCCYCSDGAFVQVFTSCSPTGPFLKVSESLSNAVHAQETDVVTLYDDSGNAQFLWRGDRWGSADDNLKSHDYTYVGLIQFDSHGVPQPLAFTNQYNLTLGPTPSSIPQPACSDTLTIGAYPSSLVVASDVSLPVGVMASFETPVLLPGTSQEYQLPTQTGQPWVWGALPVTTGGVFAPSTSTFGGISNTPSAFQPPGSPPTPDGTQFGIMITSQADSMNARTVYMGTTVSGLSVGSSYTVSFSYSTGSYQFDSYGPVGTRSTLGVYLGTTLLWTSASDLAMSTWSSLTTPSFQATASSMPLTFLVVSQCDFHHTIIVDKVTVSVAVAT